MKYWWLIALTISTSCEFFKPKETSTEIPIAKAMENYLYPSDLDGLFPPNQSESDSIKHAEKYVEDWIKKQLMISRSSEAIDFNEAEIERKVLDYRYALMVHSFEKKYIDENINRSVSNEDILKYYEDKSDNFLLRQNIIKCIYIQTPKNAPNLNQFRRNFRAYPDGNMEDLLSYVTQFATKSFLEDTTWIIFDDLILGTPLESIDNKNQFLSRNSYSETTDEENIYFLKIFDFKISDEVSPLEFIKEDIENIIINKRKIALKKELEEKIYDEAENNNLFKIYRD
ncbi:MAG: peptidyl-prolyl cis-trans isomerase [Cyclobacteriaceae bacterium]